MKGDVGRMYLSMVHNACAVGTEEGDWVLSHCKEIAWNLSRRLSSAASLGVQRSEYS